MKSEVERALAAGISYLEQKQNADGHWKDYPDLPVGASDGWVTAYVGLALTETARVPGLSDNACARRAARWLLDVRPYPAGWGYNQGTGADADTTAYSLLLLQKTGHEIRQRDVDWLLQRWQPGGGFATYPMKNAWGVAHVDVTPVAFMAVPDDRKAQRRWAVSWKSGLTRSTLTEKFTEYSLRNRQPDRTWPAYWWRTCHYSTFWNLEALKAAGWNDPPGPPLVTAEESHNIHSAFDLAFVLGIALFGDDRTLADKFGRELLQLQCADGSWPGGKNLRVTAPDCYRPWERSKGRFFLDHERLLTTATAVRMLARLNRSLERNE